MQINLYATFRQHAGVRSFDLNIPEGASLVAAIEAIVDHFPALRQHWLDENGNLYAHVHAFINGVDAGTLPQGFDTPLKSSDVLDFFPPVAGGSRL